MPKKKKDDEKEEEVEKQEIEEEQEEQEPEVVSKKRVVYAEIDDGITSIYDKIHKVKAKNLYVVVPKGAEIFQSVVNLKILKRKAEKEKKNIYLVTNDKNGAYLAQRVGIIVYDKANNDGKPAIFSAQSSDEKLRITPIKASVNSVEEEAPTRLKERKISIGEILRLNRNKKPVSVQKIQQEQENKQKKEKKKKFVLVAPNRHALMGLFIVSVVILMVIIYIALPGATIYMTPSASVLEKSVNITLADFDKNKAELDTHPKHMIAAYPIHTTVTRSITHYATGKQFSERGANASGKITIINTENRTWPLVGQTRFQTNDGIVFRITEGVTVPAAGSNGFGKLEVFVVADPTDAYGAVAGERGNIEPTSFFLPGLREDSRSSLYAESYEPMTGGVTDFVEFVSKEDIEAAKSRLADELTKSAVEELKLAVNAKTELVEGSTTYTLLEGSGAIKTGEVQVEDPSNLEGQNIKEFTINGQVVAEGVYYDHNAMLSILKSELSLKKSPRKELLRINEDSSSYRIFDWDEETGKIKLTANIKGIEQFDIDPEKDTGQKLLQKIKDHIAGKDVEEAKTYIQNLPEINKVEIESWPFWAPTIPKIPDNIEFEIRDAVMVD